MLQRERHEKPSKSKAKSPQKSERAPSPILGHAAHRLLGRVPTTTSTLRHEAWLASGGKIHPAGSVILARTVDAVLSPHAARGIPFLVVPVAGIAGAGGDAVGVEAGFLVERDEEAAVVGTEDVAAVAAVVAAGEEVEVGAALRGVAGGGLLVCLFRGNHRVSFGGSGGWECDHMLFWPASNMSRGEQLWEAEI